MWKDLLDVLNMVTLSDRKLAELFSSCSYLCVLERARSWSIESSTLRSVESSQPGG